MKRIIMLLVVGCLLLAVNVKAQTKPDSTMFRFWNREFQNELRKLKAIDTLKIKQTGIVENAYQKVFEEQKKLKVIEEKQKEKNK